MIYTVSSALYLEVLDRLVDAVGPLGYFSGSLDFVFDGVECRLTVSLIVCRRREVLPEGERDVVADLVPVWWEFHTLLDGEERLNDFSFGSLRALVG